MRIGTFIKTSVRNMAVLLALTFFGSLLNEPDVLAQKQGAQEPKLTTTIVPDDKYGKGGTKETTLDEKSLVHAERWKDKDGYTKEYHYITYNDKGAPDRESWEFCESPYQEMTTFGPLASFSLAPSEKGNWKISGKGPGIKGEMEAEGSKKDFDSFMEEVRKQFGKDGTIPPNPFTKKEEDKKVDTKVEQPKLPGNGVFTQPGAIDACLIGTWECTSFKQAESSLPEGGAGFRVTFKSDGTEEVDYSKMVPFTAKNDPGEKMFYAGKASVKILTKDGVAQIEERHAFAGVTMTVETKIKANSIVMKLPGLGPGGLGSADKNNYTCKEDSLEYNGKGGYTVKLTRVKP